MKRFIKKKTYNIFHFVSKVLIAIKKNVSRDRNETFYEHSQNTKLLFQKRGIFPS
jgi:hypothetical protein